MNLLSFLRFHTFKLWCHHKTAEALQGSRTRSGLNFTRLPEEGLPSFPMSHSTAEWRELKLPTGNKQKPGKKGMHIHLRESLQQKRTREGTLRHFRDGACLLENQLTFGSAEHSLDLQNATSMCLKNVWTKWGTGQPPHSENQSGL